jgi:hypothetical protein
VLVPAVSVLDPLNAYCLDDDQLCETARIISEGCFVWCGGLLDLFLWCDEKCCGFVEVEGLGVDFQKSARFVELVL